MQRRYSLCLVYMYKSACEEISYHGIICFHSLALFLSDPLIHACLCHEMGVQAAATPVEPVLRVAISGGGPAGLATAIALQQVPGVEVTIYEQARELREIGAGLRIGYNSWRVLELLGVADKVTGHVKIDHQHRSVP